MLTDEIRTQNQGQIDYSETIPTELRRFRKKTPLSVEKEVPPAGFEPATPALGKRCSIP